MIFKSPKEILDESTEFKKILVTNYDTLHKSLRISFDSFYKTISEAKDIITSLQICIIKITSMPNCDTCINASCAVKPKDGTIVYNCPLHINNKKD